MTQNFDPAKMTADVANLVKQVADLEAVITGKTGLNVSSITEVVEAADAAARLVGDFVPQLARIEQLIGPLLPIIPALVADYSGEIAGEGATISSGVVIPPEEIGKYESQPGNQGKS